MIEQKRVPPSEPGSQQSRESSRWAPWWVYLIVILGGNYLRQATMPVGTVPEWAVGLIVAAISATLFVLVTAVHRATHRS